MALRIAHRLPRLVVVGAVLLLASATLAVGAAKRMTAVPKGAPAPVTAPTLVVPDVAGQAFVFAKGTLEDNGFAWRVVGGVHGYAANKVATQTPAPGTKVRDTGAPTITLTLTRTSYAEKGEPEDLSPYLATALEPIAVPKPATDTTPATAAAPVAPKPAGPAPKQSEAKAAAPAARTPAFALPNAPKEPLKEMPLTQRAQLLSAWINAHPKPTSARVKHFLFQHAWVVTGAKFGWWHGAQALRDLIAADHLAQKRWGIGKKSELVARKALAEVEARTK
jgi:hypothetical protein